MQEQIKKLVLYALFGLICLSLWQSWTQYRQQHKSFAQQQHSQQPVAENQQSLNQSTTNIANKQDGIPSTAAMDKNQTPSQWITVKTDKLQVKINPKGGNIVGLKLLNYYKTLKKQKPIELLTSKRNRFFVTTDGIASKNNDSEIIHYQAKQARYQLAPNQKQLVVTLKGQTKQGLTVTKTFRFKRGQYTIDTNRSVVNNSNADWQGYFYNQMVRKKPETKGGFFRFRTFTGGAYSTPDTPYNKVSYDTIAQQGLNKTVKGGWAAFQQPYFLVAQIPQPNETYHYYARQLNQQSDFYTLGYKTQTVRLKPGETIKHESKIYTGPEIASNLKPLAKGLDLTVDYGWLWFISAIIFWVMSHIHAVVGNWGWSIILVTLFIKLLFFKLSEKSYRSMAKMRELQPQLEALKKKYGDDRQKIGQATMELYKKEKVNPLSGCLPILVQIPVFIGLYYVLIESVQLRHAPFIFWIHDLSAKDPYYILPVLMGISMFMQQKMSPKPPDPNQAKAMMALPVVFTFFFMTFPAGLVLYWLINNCLTVLQQWFIMKRLK